jgi:nitrogen fixation protein FixH
MTNPESADVDSHRARRVPRTLWLVFGLLGMNFAVVGTTITLASRDKHFAVEPDYYQRAVDWDVSQAEIARSAALGWRVSVSAAEARSASGMRTLTIRLADAEGRAVDGATVDVIAFHHGDASKRAAALMTERGPGVYQCEVGLVDPGLHEVRLVAQRGEQRFVSSVRGEWASAR